MPRQLEESYYNALSAGSIFLLEWDFAELFGWEKDKSELIVDAIIRGIEAGDRFPPVPVFREEMNRFFLSRHNHDGGHNRAVGHYIMDQPLKCRLYPRGHPSIQFEYFPIGEILLKKDKGRYLYAIRNNPNYR